MRKLRLIEKKILVVLEKGCYTEDELYTRSFGEFMGWSKGTFKILLDELIDLGLVEISYAEGVKLIKKVKL